MQKIAAFYEQSVLGKIPGIKEKLDPVSVLAVTALMRFKENMTRIQINGYNIKAQQPSDCTYIYDLQWLVRSLRIESYQDLDVIPIAIDKAAHWFSPHLEQHEQIRQLFLYAREGLEALRNTYEKKTTVIVDAIIKWESQITECTQIRDALDEPVEIKDPVIEKVQKLWTNAELCDLNSLLYQLNGTLEEKPESAENRKAKIALFELLLQQKAKKLEAIYST